MEPEVLSPKQGALSLDCLSDPEDQEISEEEDDDRNHKHRRRETRSQSLERDGSDQIYTRPYRKPNKHLENGHPFREHEKRRPGAGATFGRAHFDLNQRSRSSQTYLGDPGAGRGRGRDSAPWNHRDSRFSSVDISSQMVPIGPMGPGLFAGRGMSGVSTAQNAPWPAFGMLPGVPNGGLDPLQMGLQGTLRPNMGIPRQRCRDFEERGFCLRGDMCPMEHGINRIVIEDVQSLSQFNLPVSLPNAALMATPAGSLPSIGASSVFTGNKGVNNRGSKPGIMNDYCEAYPGVSGTDFYDPDQPLWNNSAAESSAAVTALSPLGFDESDPMIDDDHPGADNERALKNSKSSGQSVWGRIGGSKSGSDANGKPDMALNFSDPLGSKAKDEQVASASHQGAFRQGKRTFADDNSQHALESSKTQKDAMHAVRKPSQKALRTLYVSGIPKDCNKREILLNHFQKFGKVIDIHFPLNNSERAFVQFSKREEAEAALMAPDAVMGNRFIKLHWANRDSIYDAGFSSGNGMSATTGGRTAALIQSQFPASIKAKDGFQSFAPKVSKVRAMQVLPSTSDHPKPLVVNGPKVLPPQQKKAESLEQLKEELRKKQEMLEQKRNEFRKQLAKLEKQASGVTGDVANEQATKRLKVTSSGSCDSGRAGSPNTEVQSDKSKGVEHVVLESPKLSRESASVEQTNLKPQVRPVATTSARVLSRYKLDNRPTTFRVIPPLPTGLADVDILKEHFSCYGGVSNVELEDKEASDGESGSETFKSCGAHVTFTTRAAAEKAFIGGKCWRGQNLQFVWVTSNKGNNTSSAREHPLSESKRPFESDNQIMEKPLIVEAAVSGSEELIKSEREVVETSEFGEICPPSDEALNPGGENGAESLDVQDSHGAFPSPDFGAREESSAAEAR